ncbi:MAG: CBS domain-containing protein [Pseudomonadota bacterium]
MKIRDRIEYQRKLKPLTAHPDMTVSAAAKIMDERNFGSIVVVNESGGIAGIVTERDLMRRIVAKDLDGRKVQLSEIMTTNVRVAHAEDNLVDWLRQMSNDRFRHLPVVDDDGRLINVLSQGDFVSYTWPELLNRVKENTVASFGSNSQFVIIIIGVLIYSLLLPFAFNLF